MKNGFWLLKKAITKALYSLALIGTSLLGIASLLSFTALFNFDRKNGEHLALSIDGFLQQFQMIFSQLLDFSFNSVLDYAKNPNVLDGFVNSYQVLGISLATIILLGSMIGFLVILSPIKLRKRLHHFLDHFEGLPDLLFIFIINMMNIYLLKEFNFKIFPMYGFGSSQPIAFPVIVTSFLPAILYGLYLIKCMEEEEHAHYVHLGFSKGLSRSYLYFAYILRNILPVLTLKFRIILYMLLSNLILVEHMYHYEMTLTNQILYQVFRGEHVLPLIYGIGILILPIIIFESLMKLVVRQTVIRKRGEFQL
ncbi:ABC transporter permease subunit [Mesobacillus jeotgali]|uniref:ABC transporter permease subunit n=1 Tax=Mesobacillus jeotgali TaxID=129985 RepID=A0ABY9VJA0_9BACI|nr:ABC transporter permease subunit [Mesobacillus jeotgali]WNF21031.1 ABC transporter permease subunit [Mesobacillus jeotgali]